MKKSLFLMFVLTLCTLTASAAVVEDFEGTYTGDGTLVADPENSANTVLKLANVSGTDNAEVYSISLPAGTTSVSMKIYDFGANTDKTMTHYGPRWGLLGDGTGTDTLEMSCFNIRYDTYISGYKGYTVNGPQNSPLTPTGTMTSPYWVDGDFYTTGRYVKALDDADTTDVFEGQGAWATWTFDITADTLTVTVETDDLFLGTNINGDGAYTAGPHTLTGQISGVGNAETVFISAGSYHAAPIGDLKFIGCLVDDIALSADEPELHPGDANGDDVVNLDDFIALKQNYGVSPATWAQGNFNDDDVVNLDDFIILKQNYGWAAE